MEYRYWVQYDMKFRPETITVPALAGVDIYEAPPGYSMIKHDGHVVFFVDYNSPL
jgi:hypothetical protein